MSRDPFSGRFEKSARGHVSCNAGGCRFRYATESEHDVDYAYDMGCPEHGDENLAWKPFDVERGS